MTIDYQQFIESKKSLLIAPAGHGKTYTIAECVRDYTQGKQLILTHTHAGVSSLKKKFKSKDFQVPSESYNIETIDGFIQRYVLSFFPKDKILDSKGKLIQEGSSEYFKFITDKAILLFKKPLIQDILQSTYSGIFVDEYQDCSVKQHQLITNMSENIPLRMLGDPLQAIFGFNDTSINLDALKNDCDYICKLETPHRWKKYEDTSSLGNIITSIRDQLDKKQNINFSNFNDKRYHFFKINGDNFILSRDNDYTKNLRKIIINKKNLSDLDEVLFIVPEYYDEKGIPQGSISSRVKIKNKFDYFNCVKLLEAFDDDSFYSLSNKCDKALSNSSEKSLISLATSIFSNNKTVFNKWFKNKKFLTRKNDHQDQKTLDEIKGFINNINSYKDIKNFIILLKSLKDIKIKRDDLFYSLIKSLDNSIIEGITVSDSMVKQRNKIRRMGRHVNQKCLGTTLLTKGLEFDTVVILDAHKFNCPKNFYVAISRCCKRLIIFSNSDTISPYK